MNCLYLKSFNLFVGMGLFMSAMLPISGEAADSITKKTVAPVATASQSSTAAGAVEDTLKACMTRIPKDASFGQRLLAEQSCARDDHERKPFQSGLGR